MPLFEIAKREGLEVWVPYGRLLFLEPAPGALNSILTMVAIPGTTPSNQPPVQQLEVRGTVQTLAKMLDRGAE